MILLKLKDKIGWWSNSYNIHEHLFIK